MSNIKEERSIGGLRANSVAALTSLSFFVPLGFLLTIGVLVLETENNFVRFYAKQTLAVSVVLLLSSLLNLILFVGTFLFVVLGLVLSIFQIIATIKAFSGVEFQIPYIDKITNLLFAE